MPGTAWKPLLACVLALALAGCGGDDSNDEGTLTQEQADLLEDDLAQVETNVRIGNCDDAEAAARDLVETVNDLPAEAGEEVKADLRGMAENLATLAAQECVEDEASAEPKPDPEPATPPVAPTTDPTTETETTDPAEEEEEEQEEDEEEAEEEEEPQPDEPPKPPKPVPEPQPPAGTPPGQQPGGAGNAGDTGGVGEDGR